MFPAGRSTRCGSLGPPILQRIQRIVRSRHQRGSPRSSMRFRNGATGRRRARAGKQQRGANSQGRRARALPRTSPVPPTAARADKRPPVAASANLSGSASPSAAPRRLPGPAHDTSRSLPPRLRLSQCAHARPAQLRLTRAALRLPARGASRNGRWVPAEGSERRRQLPYLFR